MKKEYVQPSMVIVEIKSSELLTTSRVRIRTSDLDLDIDYGGVDEDGNLIVE